MLIEEVLIIKCANEYYGIPTADIDQISRLPLLIDIPLKPNGVRGMCAVGGSIASVVDINLMLNLQKVDASSTKTRLLNLCCEHSANALLVSEVFDTLFLDEDKIEYKNVDNDPIIAVYSHDDKLIQVLSLEIIFSLIKRIDIEGKKVYNGKYKIKGSSVEEETKFLLFKMQKELFALNIDFVTEIILPHEKYTEIAGSEEDILGLIKLRDELVIVNDLCAYYGFEHTKGAKNRILIVEYQDRKIGLLIDEIMDIKSYSLQDIEYFDENFEDQKISGVIHDTNSLISVLDNEIIRGIFAKNKPYFNATHAKEELLAQKDYVIDEAVIFRLGIKEYFFHIEQVREIIDYTPCTSVVFMNRFISGVINVRGEVVALYALHEKLGIETTLDKNSKIIICNIESGMIGFIVNGISDIVNILSTEIRYEEDEIFKNVLHLEKGKRLILGINLDYLTAQEAIS